MVGILVFVGVSVMVGAMVSVGDGVALEVARGEFFLVGSMDSVISADRVSDVGELIVSVLVIVARLSTGVSNRDPGMPRASHAERMQLNKTSRKNRSRDCVGKCFLEIGKLIKAEISLQ